jgi:Na+/melibiose symporter-like transporter
MSPAFQRTAGAAGTIAVAAAVNVATGFFTGHRADGWWISGVVLLLLGAVVQWWLPLSTSRPAAHEPGQQTFRGTIVGGSATQTMAAPGSQDVTDSQISGDLNQQQGPAT